MILDRIAATTGLSSSYVARLGLTATHRYKVYEIPKRTGGTREIAHPSRRVKFLQRWIVRNILPDAPIHTAAVAYRSGSSIRDNAAAHVGSNFFLKLDFENFFGSITDQDVYNHLENISDSIPIDLDDWDRAFVARAVTRLNALPIGAPSSPVLSNTIMYQFDIEICKLCNDLGITYTRYADDLFLSTDQAGVLAQAHRELVKVLAQLRYPKLRLNSLKTVHASRRRRRVATGLVLTSDRKISLGRDRKRGVRSMVHKLSLGQLEPEEKAYLAGFLAYADSVEPEFVQSLVRKYGAEMVNFAKGGAAQPQPN